MKILNKLSIRNFQLNKKRTISTIIGITLSVSLICAVTTLFCSFQATLVQNAVNETGYYHLKLKDVTEQNKKELQNNRDIQEIFEVSKVGYATLQDGKNPLKPYLKLHSMEKTTFEKLKFQIIEGRFPINSSELVISEQIKNNGKVVYQVGDQITLNVGKRKTLDGSTLNFSNPYIEDEILVDKEEKVFTVVGVVKRPDNHFEPYFEPGYTIITTGIETNQKDAYICLKNPMDYRVSMGEILGIPHFKDGMISEEEMAEAKYQSFFVNQELLRWEVFAFSDSTVSMIYAIGVIVIGIILVTSIFCIRNSFAIATTEKIKMYSMLISIGATKKQIKKNGILEAFLLGLIGIPLGILAGVITVLGLIQVVEFLLGSKLLNHVDGIIFDISLTSILVAIVLGVVTIYLSAISSAKKASKVSPMQGLKNTEEIKMKKKALKTPKIISTLFGIGGVLAYKNLKRNRKKYRTTVVSLAVSVCIFIAMNRLVTNVFGFTSNYYTLYDYNFVVYDDLDRLTPEELQKITSHHLVKQSFLLYETSRSNLKVFDQNQINQIDGADLIEDTYYDEQLEEEVPTGKGKYISLAMYALDDISFEEYVKKIGKDPEKLKSTGILADKCKYYDEQEKKEKEMRRYRYLEKDTIRGIFQGEEKEIMIGAVTDQKPYGLEGSYYGGGYLIVNKENFKETDFQLTKICIKTDYPDELQEELKHFNLDVKVSNFDEQVRQEKSMILIIDIFVYGFIAVITLIGVTNIFNTITSNMELRQKEFAMLKSIGMTKKEFHQMIYLETIFYGIKSLLYGIVFGLLGCVAFDEVFLQKMDVQRQIPFLPIFLAIVFVFLIVFLIMKYSVSKIKRQNIMETIRKETI